MAAPDRHARVAERRKGVDVICHRTIAVVCSWFPFATPFLYRMSVS